MSSAASGPPKWLDRLYQSALSHALNPISAEPVLPTVEQNLRQLVLAIASLPLLHQRGLHGSHPWQQLEDYGMLRSHLHKLQRQYGLASLYPELPAFLTLPLGWLREAIAAAAQEPLRSPAELGTAYEQLLGFTRQRKAGGVYYTPEPIVDYMVQQTLTPLLQHCPTPRVLDPACGGGSFLLAAFQVILTYYQQNAGQPLTLKQRSHLLQQCIFGVDIDPEAIAITRLALQLQLLPPRAPALLDPVTLPALRTTLRCGNALLPPNWEATLPTSAPNPVNAWGTPLDWQQAFGEALEAGGFDVVLGNPPYLEASWMAAAYPQQRRYCSQRYRTARGNWDVFCLFIEKAQQLCRRGGFCSLVVPNKLLSADYAAAARSLLQQVQLLSVRDYSRLQLFAAAAYPVVYIAQNQPPVSPSIAIYEQMQTPTQVAQRLPLTVIATPPQTRAALWVITGDRPLADRLTQLQQSLPSLGALASVRGAATVAEAYALQPWICDRPDLPHALRLVNSGTLDRYLLLWGHKPLRYLGNRYLHPVLPAAQLPPQRLAQAIQPKLIVAGLTRGLECALDAAGGVLAGKSTSVIQLLDPVQSPDPLGLSPAPDLRYLLGLLNSRLVCALFRLQSGGNQLQGGYLRVGPPQLRQLPMPRSNASGGNRLVSLVDQRLALTREPPSPSQTKLIQQQTELDQLIDALVCELYELEAAEATALEAGC